MERNPEILDRPASELTSPAPRPNLLGLAPEGIEKLLLDFGLPAAAARLRGKQLFHWIHAKGTASFALMTTLPADLRALLKERASIERPSIVTAQVSQDGTRKWLLRFADGQEVETVFIPERDRGALCISTQVGCTLTCKFCHTGTMPLVRNLGAMEIVAQVMVARDALADWQPKGQRHLTNIVVMGMGEPLFNYDNIKAALSLLMRADGQAFNKRRITLSTSGVVPRIAEMGEALGVGLAISLHAVRDELRDELVPINKKWDLAALMAACRSYPGTRQITFEYVMLAGVNDSLEDARAMVQLLEGVDAKVNLIPFNPWPGAPFACSPDARIRQFAAILEQAGYESPVRTPRGRDILAACGQLKTASERERRKKAA